MEGIIDDKSPHCIPFILEQLALHAAQHSQDPNPPPLFIGINGQQGIGKTTLVSSLAQTLQSAPHAVPTLVLSLDDLYLTHTAQRALAAAHPHNPLLQHRGQPGTHDIPLTRTLLTSLTHNAPTPIPAYDKSLFSGAGDRTPASTWHTVNTPPDPTLRLVLLEGWSLGFRALPPAVLATAHAASTTLHTIRLEDLEEINAALRAYGVLTDALGAFIHLDAADPRCVYAWRAQQEAEMREKRGAGMDDNQVRAFVDAFAPAYELYTPALRAGVCRGRQLRLLLGPDRRVVLVERV